MTEENATFHEICGKPGYYVVCNAKGEITHFSKPIERDTDDAAEESTPPHYSDAKFQRLIDLGLQCEGFAKTLHHLAEELDIEHGKVACRESWINLIELAEFAALELHTSADQAIGLLTEWGCAERGARSAAIPDPYRRRFDAASKARRGEQEDAKASATDSPPQ